MRRQSPPDGPERNMCWVVCGVPAGGVTSQTDVPQQKTPEWVAMQASSQLRLHLRAVCHQMVNLAWDVSDASIQASAEC